MSLVKAPFWLPWIYPGATWHRDRSEKCLFLTFDDGPVPDVTEEIIILLKKYDIQATFFCVGQNIDRNPEVFRLLQENRHRTGNHTYHHLNGWATDDQSYLDDIARCRELTQSNLFRPPYGKIRRSQLKELKNQHEIVMWDVISRDYDHRVSPEQCLRNVLRHSENGSIIVFHDHVKARKNVLYALPRAIEHWLEYGYRFDVL